MGPLGTWVGSNQESSIFFARAGTGWELRPRCLRHTSLLPCEALRSHGLRPLHHMFNGGIAAILKKVLRERLLHRAGGLAASRHRCELCVEGSRLPQHLLRLLAATLGLPISCLVLVRISAVARAAQPHSKYKQVYL